MTDATADELADAPAAKARPWPVTTAMVLLYLVAAVAVADLVIGVVDIAIVAATHPEDVTGTAITEIVVASIGLIAAPIILALVAWRIGRGGPKARTLAWTVAPLLALCCCGRLNGAYLDGYLAMAVAGGLSGPLRWLVNLRAWDSIIGIVGLFAVVLLLALPASARFFRQDEYWVNPGT